MTNSNTLVPEPYFSTYLRVMEWVILSLRATSGGEETIDPKQVSDLMDAIHNIPGLLSGESSWHTHENVIRDLQCYDARWEGKGPEMLRMSLVKIFNNVLEDKRKQLLEDGNEKQ